MLEVLYILKHPQFMVFITFFFSNLMFCIGNMQLTLINSTVMFCNSSIGGAVALSGNATISNSNFTGNSGSGVQVQMATYLQSLGGGIVIAGRDVGGANMQEIALSTTSAEHLCCYSGALESDPVYNDVFNSICSMFYLFVFFFC